MKTRFCLFTIITLIIIWLLPITSWSQLPIGVKRSNELTRNAISLFREHKADQAKQQLFKAVRLNPKNVLAHEILALIYYEEHNVAYAIKHARLAQDFDQKAPRALYVLGLINFQQGNHDLARQQLQQASASLKEPEYRERARNILKKIRANMKDKSLSQVTEKVVAPERPEGEPGPVGGFKPYIAVFPFDDANARTEQTRLGQTLTEMLMTALIQTEKFTVMERVQLDKILKEQSLGQTGIIDVETAVEVGKLSGLAGVVIGSISQLKSVIEADARLIDVETGKALTAASGRINRVDDIRELANNIARQLSVKAYLMAPQDDSLKIKN